MSWSASSELEPSYWDSFVKEIILPYWEFAATTTVGAAQHLGDSALDVANRTAVMAQQLNSLWRGCTFAANALYLLLIMYAYFKLPRNAFVFVSLCVSIPGLSSILGSAGLFFIMWAAAHPATFIALLVATNLAASKLANRLAVAVGLDFDNDGKVDVRDLLILVQRCSIVTIDWLAARLGFEPSRADVHKALAVPVELPATLDRHVRDMVTSALEHAKAEYSRGFADGAAAERAKKEKAS